MSGSLYGTRPATPITTDTPHGVSVATRLIRLDPGFFALSLVPGPADRIAGLPAVRVSAPPGPAGRREAVSIGTFRADGWMTIDDEPTLLRVLPGGAEVLVTLYWAADAAAQAPQMKLVRLNPEGAATSPSEAIMGAASGTPQPALFNTIGGAAAMPPAPAFSGPFVSPILRDPAAAQTVSAPPSASRGAEVVAHVEGVGDVDGRLGEWVGMRGSGRAIEGFSLTPRLGITPEDFEVRAVLGRDWMSPWLPGTSFCGSRGLALPLRGFILRLHPGASARFDLACFARFIDGSEVGPIGSDQVCAAPNLAPMEAFQVVVRPRAA